MKELVDGTIRVQIDIDPIHRADFFALFSRIDMPVALAPLVANFEQIKPVDETTEIGPKSASKLDNSKVSPVSTKGGELAKWAGILSNDPVFWEWADECCDFLDINDASDAAIYIREMCDVQSRAELDHNPEAAKIFREMMREFSEWRDGGKAA